MRQKNSTSELIYRQLERVLRRNRGRVQQVQTKLKMGEGGRLTRMMKSKRGMPLDTLGEVLIEFGELPEDFFREAFGLQRPPPPDPPAIGSGRWLLEVLHLDQQQEPPLIQQLREVAESLPSTEPKDSPPASPAVSRITREMLFAEMSTGSLDQRCGYLEHDFCQRSNFVHLAADVLDDLRLSKPRDAAALARYLALSACPKLPATESRDAFASITGSLASAHRLSGSIETAAHALALVIDDASPAVRGDLLQRIATLLISYACYSESLEVSTAALLIYLERADTPRLGQVFIDRGAALLLVGRCSKAQTSFENGLALLNPEDDQNRLGALQGLAQVALTQGRPEEALERYEAAQPLLGAYDPYASGTTNWLRGSIQRALGDSAGAESYLRQAQKLLWPLNVFDWSLVTLDLLSLLLESGEIVTAHKAANAVGRLLEANKSNRIAAAALQQLSHTQHSVEGLTLTAVEIARAALRQGRQLGLPPRGARPS